MAKTVTDTIEWKLYDQPKVIVPSTLTWTSDDPLTVKLSFHVGLELPIEWLVGRELLHDAITKNTAGYSDVRIAVVDDRMLMTLDSPAGTQKFVGVASEVGMFLARTYGIVAAAAEADAYDLSDANIALHFPERA